MRLLCVIMMGDAVCVCVCVCVFQSSTVTRFCVGFAVTEPAAFITEFTRAKDARSVSNAYRGEVCYLR